jgi:hypothetical protein
MLFGAEPHKIILRTGICREQRIKLGLETSLYQSQIQTQKGLSLQLTNLYQYGEKRK